MNFFTPDDIKVLEGADTRTDEEKKDDMIFFDEIITIRTMNLLEKNHPYTWCLKNQKQVRFIDLTAKECASQCLHYISAGGICDP